MRRKPAPRKPAFLAAFAASLLLFVAIPASTPVDPAPREALEVADQEDGGAAPAELVHHLARHYRIPAAAAERTANAAYLAAGETGLDPLLVLAVIGVESSFNAAAESGKGAKGLMQIVPRYHEAKLTERGGEALVLEPATNVAVGARILVECIERRGGVEAGLQSYNGARSDRSERYARKVIAERERLAAVSAGSLQEAGRPARGR